MPVTQGAAAIPDLPRHHVALRQEIAAKAVGDLVGIDLVVLLLGCRNRTQHQRVSHLDLRGMRKEMVVDPAAEDRGLHANTPDEHNHQAVSVMGASWKPSSAACLRKRISARALIC